MTNLWKFLSSCLLGKSWQQNSFKICVHFWKLEVKKLITLRDLGTWTSLFSQFEKLLLSVSLSFQKNGMSCALFFLFTGSNKIVLAADHCKLAGRTLKKCFWYHFFWSTASLCLTVSKYRALHKKDPYHHRENGSQILTIFWHPIRAAVMNTTTANVIRVVYIMKN